MILDMIITNPVYKVKFKDLYYYKIAKLTVILQKTKTSHLHLTPFIPIQKAKTGNFLNTYLFVILL
ncbi:hypothetical protein CVD19_15630 [Bacillus sp. T33-2]|nr:hypothetical protein CVD19_15630 [Bacillus sp. T33-2]